ncbi:hypothetical protein ABLB84_01870 [Xenorhabdus szentirmaii]|uniref:hypothetical protein n=1 Tax=Xenorhabdus szentirmaii TaxID=290112 RepID=UPI0032B7D843
MTTQNNDFVLDDRSLLTRLTAFQAYCRTIPFGTNGNFWDQVFFNDENTPQTLAVRFAEPGLEARNLPPQLAFLLAFLHMMDTPRRLLNSLPARHRQLYYRGELGLSELPARPDTALVIFQPESSHTELYLPEGLMLTGGQDLNGTPRLYNLQQSLSVNHARWTDLRWLREADDNRSLPVCRTLLDMSQDIAFPQQGIRLFQSEPQADMPMINGRFIVSPLLLATGEKRFITIEYVSTLPKNTNFRLEVSTQEGWKPLTQDSGVNNGYYMPEDVMPAAPVGLEGYTFLHPVLRIINQCTVTVPKVKSLTMTVHNMSNVQMRTDNGLVDVNENSYPFGSEPVSGNGFQLMSEQWCNQNVIFDITINLVWQDLPDNFTTWYSQYKAGADPISVNNTSFKAIVLPPDSDNNNPQQFFGGMDNGRISVKPIKVRLTSPQLNLTDEQAFWRHAPRVELAGQDFLHRTYRQMAINGELPPNPPYSPQFRQVNVNYVATSEKIEQYVLTPFGYQSSVPDGDDSSAPALYLGISDITPGQQLTLYWDLKTPCQIKPEGLHWSYLAETTDGEGKWVLLRQEIDDQTERLFRSGLWRTTLPKDATALSTLMPTGRYWLRAKDFVLDEADKPVEPGVPEQPQPKVEQYPWLSALYTNAGTVQLANAPELDDSHFTQSLPVGSINSTVKPFEGLAALSQPLPSWGAHARESEDEFMRRVAMRLSHRGRASSWRDISALLLARFPEVHHIRLPGLENLDGLYQPETDEQIGGDFAHKRRRVAIYEDQSALHIQTLMIVPRAGYSDSEDPLRPMLNSARLAEMQRYIESLASPWIELRVLNPEYLEVKVEYKVGWKKEANAEQCELLLAEAIKQQFMPWRDEHNIVELGHSLTIYDVMSVIQRQPYVDHVQDIKINGSQQAINTSLKVIIVHPTSEPVSPIPKNNIPPFSAEESHDE